MISINKCPECSGNHINYNRERGEITCYGCGLVIDDKVVRMEVPFKNEEEGGGKDGVGSPFSYTEEVALQTKVGNFSDIYQLPPKYRRKYKRLRIQQYRTSISIERNFKFAMPEIKRIVSQLSLPQRIEEEAARLYREIAFHGITRGRSIEGVVAAIVYASCRIQDIPVSLKDIEASSNNLSKKDIGRYYRVVTRVLNLRIAPQTPHDYIPRICGKLQLSPQIQTTALTYLTDHPSLFSGKSPISVVAAAVYISCITHKKRITQNQIAKAAGVTEVTVRNRYEDLVAALKLTPEQIKLMRRERKENQE